MGHILHTCTCTMRISQENLIEISTRCFGYHFPQLLLVTSNLTVYNRLRGGYMHLSPTHCGQLRWSQDPLTNNSLNLYVTGTANRSRQPLVTLLLARLPLLQCLQCTCMWCRRSAKYKTFTTSTMYMYYTMYSHVRDECITKTLHA